MKIFEPFYIDTSTSPPTIYMVDTAGTGLLTVGTWATRWGITSAGTLAPNTIKKTADEALTATTWTDIAGLGITVAANTDYAFDYHIVWQTSNSARTYAFSMNGPAAATYIKYRVEYQIVVNATAGAPFDCTYIAYQAMPLTAPPAANNSNFYVNIKGVFSNGANAGTLIPQVKSNFANTYTIKKGSWGVYF